MTHAQTLDSLAEFSPRSTGSAGRNTGSSTPGGNGVRTWSPGGCVWCGDRDGVELLRNEPRCGRCRELESVIDEARKFMGMYGLRPIGGTLQSDDEEEHAHRLAARDARTALNECKLEQRPDAAVVRRSVRIATAAAQEDAARRAGRPTPTATSAVTDAHSDPAGTRRPAPPAATTPAPKKARSASTSQIDVDEIQTRAVALLDQLSSIDAQLARDADRAGLAARARRSDLEKQKATILRTLAALEKARLAASN